MKKLFNYLLIIALVFGMGMSFVSAEGDGSDSMTQSGDTDAEVMVGTVETPIYDVEISWYNFVFNWVYDEQNMQYNWSRPMECVAADTLEDLPGVTEQERVQFVEDNTFYSDSNCTVIVDNPGEYLENVSVTNYVYYLAVTEEARINITDSSTRGYVTPSLLWTSEDKYEGTAATFSYIKEQAYCISADSTLLGATTGYNNEDCLGQNDYDWSTAEKLYVQKIAEVATELNGENVVLPLEAASNTCGAGCNNRDYAVRLELNHQYDVGNYDVPTPAANDTIGTVTITIETH